METGLKRKSSGKWLLKTCFEGSGQEPWMQNVLQSLKHELLAPIARL